MKEFNFFKLILFFLVILEFCLFCFGAISPLFMLKESVGWWAFNDNAALEVAVKANAPQKEMRHRINVFAEGVWFLLSNMIILQGVGLTTSSGKKDET